MGAREVTQQLRTLPVLPEGLPAACLTNTVRLGHGGWHFSPSTEEAEAGYPSSQKARTLSHCLWSRLGRCMLGVGREPLVVSSGAAWSTAGGCQDGGLAALMTAICRRQVLALLQPVFVWYLTCRPEDPAAGLLGNPGISPQWVFPGTLLHSGAR